MQKNLKSIKEDQILQVEKRNIVGSIRKNYVRDEKHEKLFLQNLKKGVESSGLTGTDKGKFPLDVTDNPVSDLIKLTETFQKQLGAALSTTGTSSKKYIADRTLLLGFYGHVEVRLALMDEALPHAGAQQGKLQSCREQLVKARSSIAEKVVQLTEGQRLSPPEMKQSTQIEIKSTPPKVGILKKPSEQKTREKKGVTFNDELGIQGEEKSKQRGVSSKPQAPVSPSRSSSALYSKPSTSTSTPSAPEPPKKDQGGGGSSTPQPGST